MLVYLLVTVVTIIGIWAYLGWKRTTKYWAERGVPYIPPTPIIGSLTFLMRQNPGTWLRQLYDSNSPYIGVWFLWRPGLIVNSPEIARRILVKDFGSFRNRYMGSGETDPIGALNLLTVNDPIWSSIRQRLTSVFTAAKLRMLQDYIGHKSKELSQRIHNDIHAAINLRVLYVDYTTDVIGTSAFGVESNAILTGKGPLRDITYDFSSFSIFRGLSWCSIFFFPDVVDLFRFKFFSRSSSDYFKTVFKTIAKNRRENTNGSGEIKDLLDALLKLKKENIDISDDNWENLIIAQAAIFLLGGYETSASVLSFITYELAYHPDVQENLYQELQEAKRQYGYKDFDSQILSELTYLNCVIKEGLRKYSPMGWMDRIAVTDYAIDEKLTVKAGTPCYINVTGMHFDPNYFPDPEKFDPERFLPENEKNIQQYTYMPFGEGPRSCVGMRFALLSMRFALASVFLNYTVQPLLDKPKPKDIKMETRCLLYLSGEPLYVKFVPRA